jgi:putative hydrolase of HD superfamily
MTRLPSLMHPISKIRKIYELKKIYRHNHVEKRNESSAEHTWSCLVLADYLLSNEKTKLDRMKVLEILLYHDLVEIEAGDIPIHHENKREKKKQKEAEALKKLAEEIPDMIAKKFLSRFTEFEECNSPESRFAKAVDGLDAMIHELDYKEDWKGWSEEMLRKFYEKKCHEFQATKELFEELVKFAKENSYVN